MEINTVVPPTTPEHPQSESRDRSRRGVFQAIGGDPMRQLAGLQKLLYIIFDVKLFLFKTGWWPGMTRVCKKMMFRPQINSQT
jgi:hypothetical protein